MLKLAFFKKSIKILFKLFIDNKMEISNLKRRNLMKKVILLGLLLSLVSMSIWADADIEFKPPDKSRPGYYLEEYHKGTEEGKQGINLFNPELTVFHSISTDDATFKERNGEKDFYDRINQYTGVIIGDLSTFVMPPRIYYEDDGLSVTVGEVEAFSDGMIGLVRIDHSKRKGGRYEVRVDMPDAKARIDANWQSIEPGANLLFFNNKFSRMSEYIKYTIRDADYAREIYQQWPVPAQHQAKGSIRDFVSFDIEKEKVFSDDTELTSWIRNFKFKSLPIRINWYVYDFVGFADCQGHWAEYSINKCQELNLIKGIGENKFAPDSTLTIAHVLHILYTYQNAERMNEKLPTPWYDNSLKWAIEKGLVTAEIDPNQAIPRYLVFELLYKYIKLNKQNLTYWNLAKPMKDQEEFVDQQEAVEALQKAEIISGYPDGYLRPQGKLTRAEMAKILDAYAYSQHKLATEDWGTQW